MENNAFSNPISHNTSEYTYRLPSPPHIFVSPPAPETEFPSDTFTSGLYDERDLIPLGLGLPWTYERRREAQLITPYVYLGPASALRDVDFLEGREPSGQLWINRPVTYVLGVRQRTAVAHDFLTGPLRRAKEHGIAYDTIEVASDQEMIHHFPRVATLIREGLWNCFRSTGKVGCAFVCCESGNEKSAAVVAALLMTRDPDIDHIKAMQLVQGQRFSATFNEELKRLLQSYGDILAADRSVKLDSAQNWQAPGRDRITKRSLARDDDRDDTANEGDADDLERFNGRSSAPFVDRR